MRQEIDGSTPLSAYEICGKPVLATGMRIDHAAIGDRGLFAYDIRHSDGGSDWLGLERSVLVNHFASVVAGEDLLGDGGWIDLDEGNFRWLGRDSTIDETFPGRWDAGDAE